MAEQFTTGDKYVCLKRGDTYHFIAQRPDGMSEDVWGDLAELIADALRTKINISSRARDFLKRADLSLSVNIDVATLIDENDR